MQRSSRRFCLVPSKCSVSRLSEDERKKARGLASPSRPQIRGEGSEKMTASTPADVFSFVRLAKRISCVSLPWDDRSVFVLAFSEWPCIVFYLQHISKLRYKFDVTACIQRLLISALKRMRQTKLPKEPWFVKCLSFDPWKEFIWHCVLKWKIWTNYLYYRESHTLRAMSNTCQYKDIWFSVQFFAGAHQITLKDTLWIRPSIGFKKTMWITHKFSPQKWICDPWKNKRTVFPQLKHSRQYLVEDDFSHRAHTWSYVHTSGDSNLLNPDVCACVQLRGQCKSLTLRWRDT